MARRLKSGSLNVETPKFNSRARTSAWMLALVSHDFLGLGIIINCPLDISAPGNGVGMKIWECYDNLAAQAWYYTDDNRIALAGQGIVPLHSCWTRTDYSTIAISVPRFLVILQGQCLDLPGGIVTNSQQVQTWQCTNLNTNQVWNI